LTRKHKQQLQEYRETTINNFDSLNNDVELLDIDNVFSDANLEISNQLSNDVFASSKECSKEFAEFSRSIIRSSTELLRGCQEKPPCNFAVVALGSVARGEATPYSDLEYAFLIENENEKDYFTQLAVDTYFRITNLNESPLKTFNIKVENSPDCLSEICPVGYRIDGLTPNAGNIPTGNGSGKSLTFTVEQAVKLYKKEVRSSSEELASLSDLLMTSQLIYCSDDGAQLHDRFMEEIAAYEKDTGRNDPETKQKRLERLSLDLQKYDFLPEFEFTTFVGEDVKVKEDIFRYITLLAINLNIALCFQLNFPWKVYEALYQSGIVSRESLRYLNIILGFSIHMRTMAYIMMGTQKAAILLSTPTADLQNKNEKHKHYYVPRKIFVTFGSILIPIKQSLILSKMQKGNMLLSTLKEKSVSEYLKSVIPSDLVTDKDDYMTICEVLCYVEDSNTALKYISAGSGVDIRSVGYEEFVKCIRSKYNTNESDDIEKKYLKMCCLLLFSAGHDSSAIDYLQILCSKEKSRLHGLHYMRIIANCMNNLSRYQPAKNILIQIKSTLEEELMIDKNTSLTEHILRKVEASTELPESLLSSFQLTYHVFHSLGRTYHHLSYLAEAKYYQGRSLIIYRQLSKKKFLGNTKENQIMESVIMSWLGDVYKDESRYSKAWENYNKSLEIRKIVHGEHTNHSDIALSYGNIGDVHIRLGNYDTALEYYTKSEKMLKAVYGEDTKHPHIASNHNNICTAYRCCGHYDKALKYCNKALKMSEVVYGEHSNHPEIATSHNNLGEVHKNLGNYDAALEYYTTSLEMKKAIYGKHTNHYSVAISYNNIGSVHRQLGNYDTALDYYTKSMEMMKAVYGEHANNSNIAIIYNNIGSVHRQQGNYNTAIEYYTKSLEMTKSIHGEHTNHSDIAISYAYIGDVHKQLRNYDAALEYYIKSLEMIDAVYNEDSAYPDLADVGSSIIDIYLEYNRYEDCLSLCYTSELSNQCLSKVLNRISTDYIRSSNCRRTTQFLQIAISKAADHSMQQADNYHQMGKWYMLMSSYKKSWCWLYSALCLYQSFPKTRDVIISLGEVHLTISYLFLHTGHVTQSLEHCQISLDYFNNLPDVNAHPVIKQKKTHLLQLSDSLHLIKILTNHF